MFYLKSSLDRFIVGAMCDKFLDFLFKIQFG